MSEIIEAKSCNGELTIRQCTGILGQLSKMEEAQWFLEPVDVVKLQLDDYFSIIKHPMDLGTIRKKIDAGQYADVASLIEDCRLVFNNAKLYNPSHHFVHVAAVTLEKEFEAKLKSLLRVQRPNGSGQAAPTPLARVPSGIVSDSVPVAKLRAIVKSMQSNTSAKVFREPVSYPGYTDVIKRPMDLSTVSKKLHAQAYRTVGDLKADVELIWSNAIEFNTADSSIGQASTTMRHFAASKLSQDGILDHLPIDYASAQQKPADRKRSLGAPTPPPPAKRKPAASAPGAVKREPSATLGEEVSPLPSSSCQLTFKSCLRLLQPLMKEPSAVFFTQPVDPVALGLPDYKTIIKQPMDLGTIEKKLERRDYKDAGGFVDDVRLVFSNAKLYNKPDSSVALAADTLSRHFESRLHHAAASVALVPAPPAAAPLPTTPAEPAAMPAPPPPAQPPPPAPPAAPPVAPPSAPPAAPPPPPAAPPPPAPRPPCGAEEVYQRYIKAVRSLKADKSTKLFHAPVKVEGYTNVISRPMDLGTVKKQLEARRYPTFEALRADLDLIATNAVTFNGVHSWVMKHVDTYRRLVEKKLVATPSKSVHSGEKDTLLKAVPLGGELMLTPHMRHVLYENSKKLEPTELLDLLGHVRLSCPNAVEILQDSKECMIDIDALNPSQFFSLDKYVRKVVAQKSDRAPLAAPKV